MNSWCEILHTHTILEFTTDSLHRVEAFEALLQLALNVVL